MKMLPRPKSIFHLGEEGGEPNDTITSRTGSHSLKRVPENLVGLRILIQHPGHISNVVIKPSLKTCGMAAWVHKSSKSVPELGFLKACHLCKRELSPHKDVYMYRGDQGFCSIECRCQQILLDERREFEASAREWFVDKASPRFSMLKRPCFQVYFQQM